MALFFIFDQMINSLAWVTSGISFIDVKGPDDFVKQFIIHYCGLVWFDVRDADNQVFIYHHNTNHTPKKLQSKYQKNKYLHIFPSALSPSIHFLLEKSY